MFNIDTFIVCLNKLGLLVFITTIFSYIVNSRLNRVGKHGN